MTVVGLAVGDIVTIHCPAPAWNPDGRTRIFRRVRIRRILDDTICFTDPRNGGSRCVLTQHVTAIHSKAGVR